MGYPAKGGRDYLDLGTWNIACSMCGRKRKANEVVRNWQGMYRCPEHDEPRQPQDFVRNVKDDMSVPFAQFEEVSYVQYSGPTFPCVAIPTVLQLLPQSSDLLDESGSPMLDESGSPILNEATSLYVSAATILRIPGWVTIQSVKWTWASGGIGISITASNSITTAFQSSSSPVSGVAQALVISSLNEQAIALVEVST